jgi:predicted RNA methylase
VTNSAPKLGNRRVTGDERYYTPPQLALELTARAAEVIPDFSDRLLIEPAGGSGSFIDAARSFGVSEILSVDTHPLHEAVKKADFLKWSPRVTAAVTLSNPPFGRNNALAVPFFNHAAGFSDYIAFLVPRSWRKWSVQNRLDLNFQLLTDDDVEVNYVDAAGLPLSSQSRLRTCFQIWQRQDTPREKVLIEDLGFVSRAPAATADLAITTFGYGCGRVHREFEPVPNTTRVFLKVNDPRVYQVIDNLQFDRFSKHTAYTEALSMQELNYLLNLALTGEPHIKKAG